MGLANPTINAHARVNLFTLESGGGFLPIALPVPDPRSAAVQFVNESTGAVIASSAADQERGRQRARDLGQQRRADLAAGEYRRTSACG